MTEPKNAGVTPTPPATPTPSAEPTAPIGTTAPVETTPPAAPTEATEATAPETPDSETPDPEASDPEAESPDLPDAESVPAEASDASTTNWSRIVAYGILPGIVLVLVLAAGYLKFVDDSVRVDGAARDGSVQAARDSTIALLSYTPDKVEQQLGDARSLLTGEFRDSYTQLTTDVVIPGAKEKQISAVATVPAAASVSADATRAVVLVFVNQTVVVGADAPTATASSVKVTLEKSGDDWLISAFDPV